MVHFSTMIVVKGQNAVGAGFQIISPDANLWVALRVYRHLDRIES